MQASLHTDLVAACNQVHEVDLVRTTLSLQNLVCRHASKITYRLVAVMQASLRTDLFAVMKVISESDLSSFQKHANLEIHGHFVL